MAEKSGFFNAVMVDNEYDRKYNANDYSDNLAVVISNGVLRSTNDDLKVTSSGMAVAVNAGRAWINGHYYVNDSTYTFSATPPTTGGKRYDRVMLRCTTELLGRKIFLVYVQGTEAASPVKPSPTRTSTIYDLVLADIFIDTNATSVTVTDTRSDTSVCGWVYSTTGDKSFFTSLDNSFDTWFQETKNTLSSVTLFKRYVWTTTLATASSGVSFDIPQYDADTCFLEVYVNGILDRAFTLSDTVITFDGSLIAGTVITVYCYKSIDGTGIQTVSGEITQLQNQMATVIGTNKFVYRCTGIDDNISLSEIAQAIYSGSYTVGSLSTAAETFLSAIGGNTYIAAMSDEAQISIDVVGRLGATTAAAGSGTSASRYRWFNIGLSATSDKKIIFDFAKCEKITISCAASTSNIVFYGTDLNIKNANVYAYSNGTSCQITMMTDSARNGYINCDNCRFSITTSGDAIIAENGVFVNCYGIVKSLAGNAICFDGKSTSLIRLIAGTYYAYVADSSKVAAIMEITSTDTNAVIIATNLNAPTVSLTGYTQKNLAVANSGNMYISGVVSTMPSSGTTATINGQIWKSKR